MYAFKVVLASSLEIFIIIIDIFV